ncbi:MAG: DUF2220 family protein [Actinobacteria bacterium]|nr:DUF2220 family protein [Actinomycetota bacterium]MCL5445576.1 DUF2220 family protein [Actinomycetota bacterium]
MAVVRKRWATGRYARDHASGVPWTPIELPVKAPTATELLERFDEVRRWAERFERDSKTAGGVERFTVIKRSVKGRNLGANSVPARVRIESFEQLCKLLKTTDDVVNLDAIINETRAALPDLVPWVASNPLKAISHLGLWNDLVETVAWIVAHGTDQLFLRQIDVEGVDTKFVDRHRKILDELLTCVLPAEGIDSRYGAGDFARRFRFRAKPSYTRLRLLEPQPLFPAGVSELTLRTEELSGIELTCETVFVVENEISYLAFPAVKGAIVVFGSGFALGSLYDVSWMESKEIVYWGDIDTHGFDILSRLRARFGRVRSILMDQETLLAHSRQWVSEPTPTNRALNSLTAQETALYNDLIEDRYGQAVRLEQERVRFSLVLDALARWPLVK